MTDIDFDLDTLARPSFKLKLGKNEDGSPKVYEIQPLEVVDLLKLGQAQERVKAIQGSPTPESAFELLNVIREILKELVPQLPIEQLNINQLLYVMNILTSLTVPSESKELDQAGISTDTSEKKIESDTLTTLPDSLDSSQPTQ